ncbi:AAA family ATPase [Kribbella sp. CA-253562]|uniref:AAA family ATPase n=1 Tax=Kribbella sp. CA-253562 TaxID=3239942 RepID=UPI003D8DC590
MDHLLAEGRAGRSAVLVVRGEPGVGKTALIEYAGAQAEGWKIVRAAGVESEMELPYAGLQQLCASLLTGADRLPAPQHHALSTAFGLSAGDRPDRFLVGLAVLTLLSNVAEKAPLLCLVDDVQWLDDSSVQVLAFVARRLKAESVVLLFSERDTADLDELAQLPALLLPGLADTPAREVLASVITGPLDERVRDRILDESRGNPLALLESPNLAGGFGLPSGPTVAGRLERGFGARVGRLPAATRQFLLLAAAEPTGDPTLLVRAATELGIPLTAMNPAEAEGLIEIGARTAFRHSLLRSAVYRTASAEERRGAHRALASATDATADPDRRAWHRAHGTLVADEDVAAELERSAGRAQARGGLAAAAAFLEYAARLTPEPGRRARRALAAARAKQLSGAPEPAMSLLAIAAAGPLDAFDAAMLQRLYGQVALDLRRGISAVPLLLDAAKRLEPLDPELARETYAEALRAASIAGRFGDGVLKVAAEAARLAPPATGTPRAVDLLLDGLAVRFTDGYAAGAVPLKRALRAVRDDDGGGGRDVRWPWSVRRVAPDLFDDEIWHAIAPRNVQIVRSSGALSVLPLALHSLSTLRIFGGELDAAQAALEEADAICAATATPAILFGWLVLAGWRGDEAPAAALMRAHEAEATKREEGVVLTFSEYARAVLHNGNGHYDEALSAASSATSHDELLASVWALPELIEAAARCDRPDLATDALEQLLVRTDAAGTPLAAGIAARSQALLSEGSEAENHYLEATVQLGRTRSHAALARTQLLYGEWLRRENRRVDARVQLNHAYEALSRMGIAAFAERARRELVATGQRVRTRTVSAEALTAQEAQIAGLAVVGRTNPEIGAELFLSPRTVEWHLRKVFIKLGVTSRRQLRAARSGSGWISPRI